MPTAKDMIRNSAETGTMVMNAYLEDLPEEALFESPGPGMNPLAWQVGHLISTEKDWVEKIKSGSCPTLPEGFDAAHSKETAAPQFFQKGRHQGRVPRRLERPARRDARRARHDA